MNGSDAAPKIPDDVKKSLSSKWFFYFAPKNGGGVSPSRYPGIFLEFMASRADKHLGKKTCKKGVKTPGRCLVRGFFQKKNHPGEGGGVPGKLGKNMRVYPNRSN